MTRSRVAVVTALLFAFCGCHSPVETRANHVVHKGEKARLWSPDAKEVYMASGKEECHQLAKLVAEKRDGDVAAMVTGGKAFGEPTGTRVEVIGESYNERQVQVLGGPHAGRIGWVPFEWLKSIGILDP